MAVTNLMIGIGAEYKGRGAFKQAETATQKLTKSVKNLAGAVGIAFSARAVANFAKVSIKASLENSAQQDRLAKLLQVTNGATQAQIALLTDQANALERVGVVTAGSITQVQSQLATFDLSISTIKTLTPAILDYVTAEKGATASAADFKSATNGLAQALNGNFASLTKVGFVLDSVTKKTIATGSESERAAAIVKVLESTYKGFNERLAQTPAGKMQLLANAADDAKVIIGDGLVNALTQLTDGNVVALADSMRDLATETQYVIIGIGELVEKFKSIPGFGKLEFDYTLIPVVGSYIGFIRDLGEESVNTTKALAEMMKYPDPQSGRQLDARLKIIAKTNKALEKAEKERLAAEKKKTAELKKQAALAKARAVLEKADTVFNMDLIQNTAALMGKLTEDETLRLKLQQAILLDNTKAAGELSQQLLTAQIDALILSNIDPFNKFTDGAANALAAMIKLREEMGKLTKPVLTAGEQLLAQDFAAVILDQNDPEILAMEKEIREGMAALSNLPKGGMGAPSLENYQDAFARPNADRGFTPTELRIFIDPTAAQYGIGVASVNNSANGNNNNYSTIQSFAGGL
jgi:hypothetical protein